MQRCRIGAVVALLGLWATTAYAANQCAPGASPPSPATCSNTFGSVQAAVNAAAAGDTVYLHAGQTYTESVQLPNKGTLQSNVLITSDTALANFKAAGVRVGISDATYMPKIQSPGGGSPALWTADGANHYTIRYIEFPNVPQGANNIINLGNITGQFRSQEASFITIDQCYLHGDPVAGQLRGIDTAGMNLTITNSYFSQFVAVGQDSQCIAGANGAGPLDIENNYLECGTENIIIGGDDPYERTYLAVSGTPTTTSASVSTTETGHTLSELWVGQTIGILTNNGNTIEYATISTITGTGSSGSITWSPATTFTPAVPGGIHGGVVLNGLTFRRNYVTKQTSWMNGVLATPTSPSAAASTSSGSLAAGTYYYQVQAFSPNGYAGQWVNGGLSSEVTATLSATGKITVSFAGVSNATVYRIWRGNQPATENQWADCTASPCVDDGTLQYTTATEFGATQWQIKDLFELKAATNVQVDSNVFAYAWPGASIGYNGAWLKSANQVGGCWFCQTSNVIIEKNFYEHMAGFMLMHGQEVPQGSGFYLPPPMTNVTIRNNLLIDSTPTWEQNQFPYAFNITGDIPGLVINHNTIIHTITSGLIALQAETTLSPNFVFENNMVERDTYGVHGPGLAEGTPALAAYATTYTFTNNDIADASSSNYPAGNFYDAQSAWQNEFTCYSVDGTSQGCGAANYAIKVSGAMHNAGTDGKDVGADITALNAAIAGVTGSGGGTTQLIVSPASLPNGVLTVAYSQTISASGGTSPYTWSVSSGSLPTSLSLNTSTGAITGTPTVAGTSSFTIKVTDSGSPAQSVSTPYTVTMYAAVAITTSSLPSGTVTIPYSQTIAYTGGTAPYTCAVISGTLPAGLALGYSTCTLSGTPTTSGSSTFTVQVAEGLGSSVSQAYTVSIALPADVLPSGRPEAMGSIPVQAAVFRMPTDPTNTTPGCCAVGDININTGSIPPVVKMAVVGNPVNWQPLSASSATQIAGDGSQLTNLNASNLATGTVPAGRLPSTATISNLTSSMFTASTAQVGNYVDFTAAPCTTLSGTGHARLCMDPTSNQLTLSQNGNGYVPFGNALLIGGNSYGANIKFGSLDANPVTWDTNGQDRIVIQSNGDTYFNADAQLNMAMWLETVGGATDIFGLGVTTANGRKWTLSSQTGTLREGMVFSDPNASTDTVFGLGLSTNSGSSYTQAFRVTDDWLFHTTVPAANGTVPTLSGCGTGASVVGGAMVFRITVGTSPGTCVATFQTPATLPNAPICVVSNSAGTAVGSTVTASAMTVTGSIANGNLISAQCTAY